MTSDATPAPALLDDANASDPVERLLEESWDGRSRRMSRRELVSESLAAVVSQLLLRTPDGRGRVAVHEILLKTPGLPNVIREGNTAMINNIIQGGKGMGMQQMDDALFKLVQDKRIDVEDAFHKATHKARFEPLLEQH